MKKNGEEPVVALARLLAVLLLVEGCAHSQRVALAPPQERQAAEVERDREECRAKAVPTPSQVASAVGQGIGAPLMGLLLGIPIGAVIGFSAAVQAAQDSLHPPRDLAIGIVAGAFVGGAVGFVGGLVAAAKVPAQKMAEMDHAYEECLRMRGYTVPSGDQE